MKAAVLHQFGQAPQYEDFPDPKPADAAQALIHVLAASVKNLDKGRASGAHYAKHEKLPDVVGVDGVGVLDNGQRVYAGGLTGMIAEKALVDRTRITPVPPTVDDVTAAALPNAVLGAALALRYRADIHPGNTVLINGATGVTGQVAVQIAKYYGAARVIATGRNKESLQRLQTLGADVTVSLLEEDFSDRIRALHQEQPFDIIIDYLWGQPAEYILGALKGGGLHTVAHRVRFVTVGSMAGEGINLSSNILRSSAIEILGSGFGSLPGEALHSLRTDILPEMFELAAAGRLKIDTVTAPLSDITRAWTQNVPAGQRLVITI